tara:strand:- start:1729 stop:2877 length:1149 start_codon:yes stop_codon:yes gene_type:complete
MSNWSDITTPRDYVTGLFKEKAYVEDNAFQNTNEYRVIALTKPVRYSGPAPSGTSSDVASKYWFVGRILDKGMSHYNFLENPCAQSVSSSRMLQYLHTKVVLSTSGEEPDFTAGDAIYATIEPGSADILYGLQFMKFVRVDDKDDKMPEVFEYNCEEHDYDWADATSYGGASTGGIPSNAPGDPGSCNWSNGVKRLTTTWSSTEFPEYNGKVLYNGSLQDSGMLAIDSKRGPELVPPAMEDFLKLAAAYEAKFPGKILKGSGYRSYEGQVYQRMRRASSATSCDQAKKSSLGAAATPGRSNHGWGAAVDLDRSNWTGGRGNSSPEFRWLNKFSKDFNFVFGVRGEHWHIDWMKFGAQTGGAITTKQTAWTPAGQNDTSITLT